MTIDKNKNFQPLYLESPYSQPQYAYKIQPMHGIGDTPAAVALRILAVAGNYITKASGVLVAIGIGHVAFPWSLGFGFAAWKLGGLIQDECRELASFKDIDNLLNKQDMVAIEALIGKGKYLAEKVKKYKTLADVPDPLRRELDEYLNDHYYSIKALKNAIAMAQVKEKKRRSSIEININND